MSKLVELDPDGSLDHDWMAVIVRAETGVSYRQQYGGHACRSQPLMLDDTRLGEVDEAWIPVTCPDGPGILTWPNSD